MLALTVAFTTVARWHLSGYRSYWLDELYSVYAYTLVPDGAIDAIRTLADTSIHPPLYQSVLYQWVALFGDGETATRTLSSLYVALAVVVLHRLVARQFDHRTADAAAVVFAVSYAATYYGMETRSYAQTLLLATLSMYTLERYLHDRRPTTSRWRPSSSAVWFTLANLGLLLTHYYNAFFVAAQAVLVVGYLVARRYGSAVRDVLAVVGSYAAQLLLFALIWGRQTIASYRDDSGNYDTAVPDHGPIDMAAQVLSENLTVGGFAPVVLVIGTLAAVGIGAAALRRTRDATTEVRVPTFGLLHAGWMAVAPAAVAYVAFLVVQAERYSTRYFLFLVPAFSVLAAWFALRVIDALTSRLANDGAGRSLRRVLAAPVTLPLLLAALLTLPGGHAAATEPKADWRGTAERIVAIRSSDPGSSYAIYETSFRVRSVLDYYLRRHDDDLRVDGLIRRIEERQGGPYGFEEDVEELREQDFLIVPFVHHTVDDLPGAVAELDRTFTRHLVDLDPEGRGLMIYDTTAPG